MAKTEAKEPKATTSGRGVCLFSGKPTGSKRSRFLPGNDAKLKSQLLKIMRGEAQLSTIRKAAIEALREPGGLCGFQLGAGDKLKVTGNFSVGAGKAAKKATPAAKKEKAAKPAPVALVEDEEEEEEEE